MSTSATAKLALTYIDLPSSTYNPVPNSRIFDIFPVSETELGTQLAMGHNSVLFLFGLQ